MNTKVILPGILLPLPVLRITNPRSTALRFPRLVAVLLILLSSFAIRHSSLAQGTAFTYQGRLTDGGDSASGLYELRFALWDDAAGGIAVAGPVTNRPVAVSNGLFTVTLDFGSEAFGGGPRWLAIGVRPFGNFNPYTPLTPRQSIDSAPYAIQAATAAALKGTLPDAQLSANIPRLSSSITFTSSVSFSPASGSPFTIAGSSSNKLVKGLNADKLGGKSATELVLKAGDTMTGPLSLPTNGLTAGANQLVLSGGKVGIGTANPAQNLTILGTPSAALGLQRNDSGRTFTLTTHDIFGGGSFDAPLSDQETGNIAFKFSRNSGLTDLLTVLGNGNVGIGTFPDAKLTVNSPNANNTALKIRYAGAQSANVLEVRDVLDGLRWHADNNANLFLDNVNLQVGANTLFADHSSGNVGIGTAAPQARLQVSGGNVLISQDYFLLGGTGHGGFEQLIRSRGMGYDNFGYPGVQVGQERDHIALFIDPRSVAGGAFDGSIENEIMTPNKFIIRQANSNGDNWLLGATFDNGKLGIGTENPIDALSLGFGRSMSFDANDSAQTSRLRFRYQGTEYEWIERPHVTGGLAFGTDKFERMRIDGYGNVGIGTTTPWAKLTIAGKSSPYQVYHDDPVLLLSNTNALRVADEGVSLGFNRGSHFLYGAIKGAASNDDQNKSDGYLAFFTTDYTSYHAEQMRILGNGNIGISTATPQERLHVAGNIAVSAPNQFIARYQNENNDYSASLGWNSLQLGNNGANYIIAGRTLRGSSLIFVVDNTNDYHPSSTPINGKEVMALLPNGNVGIGTDAPGAQLEVAGPSAKIRLNRNDGTGLFDLGVSSVMTGSSADFFVTPGQPNSGVVLRGRDSGGSIIDALGIDRNGNVGIGTTSPSAKLEVAGEVKATVFTPTSDRNAKENFATVDAKAVLEKVSALPITRWNFKELAGTEHIGPMAQDFHAAFGVGADDKHITTVDADGVALAAIQGLYEVVREKDARITKLETELAELKRAVQSLARDNNEK